MSGGLLSNAQLESVILAGEAHADHLAGSWTVDETFDVVSAAPDGAEDAVRFRRGWLLGDGTGAGKGRQVAGILLDNWLEGRQRALWVSKSDTLIEDAQRDWAALGQERLLVTPLSRFRPGVPITLDRGILFTTYATLRGEGGEGAVPRVQQIVDWLGRAFDGVIVFDESHALRNAGGTTGFGREGGPCTPSQQGRAGLRLQHALPDARVLYVSATGATTVHNLAYAQRLGLWGGTDFPFASRAEFVQAIEAGGVAAMEVLARDLKALGLYSARSLSFDGVAYAMLEHRLTPGQVAVYDAYADAFQVIHANLDAALEAANVTGRGGTLNRAAKAAARSAFESSKQRFFNHLITAMKGTTLLRAIERDLAAGHAVVVQIVSTGEALLAFLEYRLLSLAAYLAIPFAVLGPTSFVAERAIGYIAASALKLLVLGCIIAMCSATLLALTFTSTPTLAQAFGVAVLAAAIFVLAIKAPRAAAGLVNGGPVMDGMTALAALWTAGWLGMRSMAGAAAATSGSPGSLTGGALAAWGGLRHIAGGATSSVGSTGGGAGGVGGAGGGTGGGAAGASAGRRYPGGRFGGSRASAPRGSGWDKPMTDAQRGELDRLAAGRAVDPNLTRGQASRLIERWGGEDSWLRRTASHATERPQDPPGQTPGTDRRADDKETDPS